MASRLYNVTVDAHDPRALAEFWRRVLDYRTAFSTPDEVAVESTSARATCPGWSWLIQRATKSVF
jgi:hypothetical protein